MEQRDETFSFTYSAAQQAEVEKIREKYLPREEDKMEQLRRLDRSVSRKANSWAIALGVIGALVLGMGMSLCMTDLGQKLGIPVDVAMTVGVAAGLVGMVLVALAYPVHSHTMKKERARIAPEILRLTEELLQ